MDRRTVGNSAVIILDIVSLAIGFYGIYNVSLLELPDHLKGAGKWQFLTNISLMYSLVIFTMGLISHLIKSERLFRIKNLIHTFGFVAELVVFTVYWPLRLFFVHRLVKDGQVRIDLWTDFSIHVMPTVSLALDFFLFMPNFSIRTELAFLGCISMTSLYWFWLNSIVDFENGGRFPYEFLNGESSAVRACVFWGIGISAFLQFLLMRYLYDKLIAKRVSLESKNR